MWLTIAGEVFRKGADPFQDNAGWESTLYQASKLSRRNAPVVGCGPEGTTGRDQLARDTDEVGIVFSG